MMGAFVLITLHLLVLHSVDGREVHVNPALVTSLHADKPDTPNTLMTDDVHCVISLVDGKFVSVVESCSVVRNMLLEEDAK